VSDKEKAAKQAETVPGAAAQKAKTPTQRVDESSKHLVLVHIRICRVKSSFQKLAQLK